MLRARVLFYWAKSYDAACVSRSGLMKLWEMPVWDDVAARLALSKVPREFGCSLDGEVVRFASADTKAADVRRVFMYWRQRTGRGSRISLTADRSRRIRARLRSHSADELCLAVDGLMRSSWHTGSNPDGRRYTEISHVFGNDEKTDSFIALADERDEDQFDGIEAEMARRRRS